MHASISADSDCAVSRTPSPKGVHAERRAGAFSRSPAISPIGLPEGADRCGQLNLPEMRQVSEAEFYVKVYGLVDPDNLLAALMLRKRLFAEQCLVTSGIVID
jgi:hypothetical protein